MGLCLGALLSTLLAGFSVAYSTSVGSVSRLVDWDRCFCLVLRLRLGFLLLPLLLLPPLDYHATSLCLHGMLNSTNLTLNLKIRTLLICCSGSRNPLLRSFHNLLQFVFVSCPLACPYTRRISARLPRTPFSRCYHPSLCLLPPFGNTRLRQMFSSPLPLPTSCL
jgi:hypothetical protein